MKKADAISSIASCFSELMEGITNKFTPEKKHIFEKNVATIYCDELSTISECKQKVWTGLWD